MNQESYFYGGDSTPLAPAILPVSVLGNLFDNPVPAGLGYQKEPGPSMLMRCSTEPDHSGFPTLTLYFVHLNFVWGHHHEIRRIDSLVCNP